MTLRTYLWGMAVSAILCFVSFALVVVYIDPTSADLAGFIFIYLSLFFGLVSSFTLFGFYIRKRISKDKADFTKAVISFRQGIMFALIFTGLLFLQSYRLLLWWNAALFVLAISLFEFYLQSKDR